MQLILDFMQIRQLRPSMIKPESDIKIGANIQQFRESKFFHYYLSNLAIFHRKSSYMFNN